MLPATVVVAETTSSHWYWTGDANPGVWDAASANWNSAFNGGTPGAPTGPVDVAHFSAIGEGAQTVTLGANVQVGGLEFEPGVGAITLNGGSSGLKINAFGINVASGAAAHAINAPIRLLANQSWTVFGSSAANLLTVSGVVSDGGSSKSLTKAGAGILALTAANTFGGTTTITDGTLRVSSLTDGGLASGIGRSNSDAGNLVLGTATAPGAANATLEYVGSTTANTNRLFTLGRSASSVTISSSGTAALNFTNSGPIAMVGSNPRTLTLAAISSNLTNSFAPLIGDNGVDATSLVKTGQGTWTIVQSTATAPTVKGRGHEHPFAQ